MRVFLIYHHTANKTHSELNAEARRIFSTLSHMVSIEKILISPCEQGQALFKTGYKVEVMIEKTGDHKFMTMYKAIHHVVEKAASKHGIVRAKFISNKDDNKKYRIDL